MAQAPAPAPVPQKSGLLGRLSEVMGGATGGRRRSGGIDLDLGCMFELSDGRKGLVQALGLAVGVAALIFQQPSDDVERRRIADRRRAVVVTVSPMHTNQMDIRSGRFPRPP